ncbi:MAG: hypothetical protein U0237_17445 [Thermoleophilia bacterium]
MPVLSELLGRDVVDEDGRRTGVVADLGVRLDDVHPPVRELVVRTGRTRRWAPREAVLELEGDRAVVRAAALVDGEPPDALLLGRDVLDTQVFDVRGRAMARVGDVALVRSGEGLRVAGVQVGMGSVLRRIGLRRLAGRLRDDPVDWEAVHLTSRHGHALELDAPDPRRARLTPGALSALVARLPPARGAELLSRVDPAPAAEALGRQRPRHGGRLVRELGTRGAAPIVAAMARDDATAALRHLTSARRDRLLAEMGEDRAEVLRRLLAHPPHTAAGLMNPDVLRAREGTPAAELLALATAAPTRLDAMRTVVVVDADDRVVGAVPPRELLAGTCRVLPTPVVAADAGTDVVDDAFATHDILLLPVAGADGRLIGGIAVDDVLEELLAARLPGRRRYPHLGRRR